LVAPPLDTFMTPRPLVEGVDRVGDPIAVLPTVFHLLWSGLLRTDLTARLDATSLATA
jgi:hypothetical protein